MASTESTLDATHRVGVRRVGDTNDNAEAAAAAIIDAMQASAYVCADAMQPGRRDALLRPAP